MTSSLAPYDAINESRRFIHALERRQHVLTFADTLLSLHYTAHQHLENSYDISEQAVEAWRAALADRWECEVAVRRLYKQVIRQLTDHYGEMAPQMQLITRGGAEINSSPAELMEDLRRLHAALTVELETLPFAAERLPQIDQVYDQLDHAIDVANQTEQRRRNAVLENRMAREAFRRTSEATLGKLAAHYGDQFNDEFQELLEAKTA